MKVLIIVFSTCLIFLLSGCGQSVGSDVGSDVERYNPELDKDCTRCDLRGADLVLADLTGADLMKADLEGANLIKADLSDANLSGANLLFVLLVLADLTGANLEGANLDGVIGADFSGALNVSPKYLKDSESLNPDIPEITGHSSRLSSVLPKKNPQAQG